METKTEVAPKRGRKAREITWPNGNFTIKDGAKLNQMSIVAFSKRVNSAVSSNLLKYSAKAEQIGKGRKASLYCLNGH